MVNIGDLIYRTTGIMTKKTILRKSYAVGEKATEAALEHGKLRRQEFSEIFETTIGKRAGKIDLVTDKEETIKAMQKMLDVSEEIARKIYASSASMVIPPNKNAHTLLNLRLDDMPQHAVGNISAHETEHALFDTFSLYAKVRKTLLRIPFIKNFAEKLSKKYGDVFNSRSNILQENMIQSTGLVSPVGLTQNENILEHIGLHNKKTLRKFLRSIIYGSKTLIPGEYKQNYIIADSLKNLFKDEARAYRVGGKAEQTYYKLQGLDTKGKATISELRAELYKEAIKVLNREEKRSLIKWLKSKLGISSSNKTENAAIKKFNQFIEKLKQYELDEAKMRQVNEEDAFWSNAINYAT